MRFLIDNALSPRLSEALCVAGHDAIHVRDIGLASAIDELVLARAEQEDRILVSADTDFSTILSRTGAVSPSVILFRRIGGRRPLEQAELLLSNLPAIADDLVRGSVVVFDQSRIRVRSLPILG